MKTFKFRKKMLLFLPILFVIFSLLSCSKKSLAKPLIQKENYEVLIYSILQKGLDGGNKIVVTQPVFASWKYSIPRGEFRLSSTQKEEEIPDTETDKISNPGVCAFLIFLLGGCVLIVICALKDIFRKKKKNVCNSKF